MFWFTKKKPSKTYQAADSVLEPTALVVNFDSKICSSKLQSMLNMTESFGGIDGYIKALNQKHAVFADSFSVKSPSCLSRTQVKSLLALVYNELDVLPNILKTIPDNLLQTQIWHLIHGNADISSRMNQFVQFIHAEEGKVNRAAWDFAAEILHFTYPEKYPLMSNWVWNQKTQIGALREFVGEPVNHIDAAIGSTPSDFEAARVWLAEQLGQQGFYRDIHYLIDLLLAQAYSDYLLTIPNKLSLFDPDVKQREINSVDIIVKLLGIDHPVKREQAKRIPVVVH